jgi:hypothetical protein
MEPSGSCFVVFNGKKQKDLLLLSSSDLQQDSGWIMTAFQQTKSWLAVSAEPTEGGHHDYSRQQKLKRFPCQPTLPGANGREETGMSSQGRQPAVIQEQATIDEKLFSISLHRQQLFDVGLHGWILGASSFQERFAPGFIHDA